MATSPYTLTGTKFPPPPQTLPSQASACPIHNDHRRWVDLPSPSIRLPDQGPPHIDRLEHIRVEEPNRVRACLVRRDGPMRVGIIEAHNRNCTARLDQGQQLRPVRLLV